LQGRVNRLARVLGTLGVARGDRVATWLPNGLPHVMAQLGVVRAGAAWVAINRRLAPPEIRFMLEHSGARVLLADGSVSAAAVPAGVEVLDVTGADAALERRLAAVDEREPELRLDESDVARLRYTSGTTGRPKAAVLTHASSLASLRNLLAELHELGSGDVVCHVAPLTHASEALVAPALWRGARAVLCTGFDAPSLRRLIAREHVTTLFAVPTMIRALVDDTDGDPADFASLRTIVYGAAPIARDVVQRALERLGPVLLQIYGLSECPFPITTLRKEDHLDPRLVGSCGLPTSVSEVRILDDAGAAVAPGEVGRIVVRGPQMMREYWGDPPATAAVLRDGWLWTDDLGSRDDRGYLTLVDRSDDVIISGGFNVYPREVEIALEEHPAVAEAGVAAIAHERWGQGVCAWIVRRGGATIDADALIEHCRARLAGYKKPVEVRFVAALPKSPTGKLLRRALRDEPAPR
jgi:fatty-acyl-CoA synthase